MAALIVLLATALAMVVAFGVFYRHSRTPEWGDSETRKAFLSMLMVIGPFFGMRYEARQPTPTEISTPYRGDDDAVPDGAVDPRAPVSDAGQPKGAPSNGAGEAPPNGADEAPQTN